MKKDIILVFLLLALSQAGHAQAYKAQASLPAITDNGFYRVLLTPDIAVHVNERFSNIRIFNESNAEVPYLFAADPVSKQSVEFREYAIEQQLQVEDSCTIVILRNTSGQPIHSVSLLIRNAEITKEVTLSGSDDQKQWYALKERFFLSNINSAISTSELKIVDFPLSSYRYYRLWINDKKSAPLNIIKAGYYSNTIDETASYFPVPVLKLSQADSIREKKSYVRADFDTLRLIDKIIWKVSGSPFFLRRASLYTEKERVNKKGNTEKYREYISSIQPKLLQ